MIALPVLPPIAPVPALMRDFGSRKHPLRPSSLVRVGACPMSAVLYDDMTNDEGGAAAQTGNLVHEAAAAFHRSASSMDLKARTAEGLAALEAARQEFPDGNVAKAVEIYGAYSADKENIDADCPWVERRVVLELEAAAFDPTGEPVVIQGTLDQIRRYPDGSLELWDIKTGSRKTGKESLLSYSVQQACYLLAARQTLSPDITLGGLIYTPGYEKKLGKRFFRYQMTPEQCNILVSSVVYTVALVRMGVPLFRPGSDTCEWCKAAVKSPEHCLPEFLSSFDVRFPA